MEKIKFSFPGTNWLYPLCTFLILISVQAHKSYSEEPAQQPPATDPNTPGAQLPTQVQQAPADLQQDPGSAQNSIVPAIDPNQAENLPDQNFTAEPETADSDTNSTSTDNPQTETTTENTASNSNPASGEESGQGTNQESDTESLEQRYTPNRVKGYEQSLKSWLTTLRRDEEVVPLNDDTEDFEGLFLPENTGLPQGGVLILHDQDHHAHWPHVIAPLREYLPDYGWTTLTISLPSSLGKLIPRRTLPPKDQAIEDTPGPSGSDPDSPVTEAEAAVAPNENAVTEDPRSEPYLRQLEMRIARSVAFLNEKGQFNLVLVAHGTAANWLTQYLANRFEKEADGDPGDQSGFAVILIEPNESLRPEVDVAALMSNLDIPLLDLYFGQTHNSRNFAKIRRNYMGRNNRQAYLQIKIPRALNEHMRHDNQITRRVRGWLKNNAAGQEATIAN